MKRILLSSAAAVAMLGASAGFAAAHDDDCDEGYVTRSYRSYPARGYVRTGYYGRPYYAYSSYYDDDDDYYDGVGVGYYSTGIYGGSRRHFRSHGIRRAGFTGVRAYQSSGTGIRSGSYRSGDAIGVNAGGSRGGSGLSGGAGVGGGGGHGGARGR